MSARRWIVLALACSWALARPQLVAAAEDDELDLGEDEAQQAEEAPAEASPAEGEDQPAAEAGEAAEPAAAQGEGEGEAEADSATTLRARVVAGAGVGTRYVRRPIEGGAQRLPTAVFPAADLGLFVRIWPDAAFSFDVMLHYQTSLGLTLEEEPLFALPNEVQVRSEHVELGGAPSWRLSDSLGAARFGVPFGMAMRNFWPDVHQTLTPRYTLFGPYVRFELDFPLASVVRLRFGAEAQMFFIVGTDLLDNGVNQPGVALGGEASLSFRLHEGFLIDLRYRQSNALASSSGSESFLDVERFATLCLVGEM
jgi:hypothetical protein